MNIVNFFCALDFVLFELNGELIFFRPYFHYCLSSAHRCEDHFHSRLYPQFKYMTFIYSQPSRVSIYRGLSKFYARKCLITSMKRSYALDL